MNLKEDKEKWLCNLHTYPQVRSLFSKRNFQDKGVGRGLVSAGRAACSDSFVTG